VTSFSERSIRVVVIGAGRAGPSVGCYLRGAGLTARTDYVILDAGTAPGVAWQPATQDAQVSP
jgi:cation diffusion facilitator CzcD-associated flavoprotein CzcO